MSEDELMKLFNDLQKIWFKLDSAKNLVDDGKEVLCSNKLQGALCGLKIVINSIGKEINNNVVVQEDRCD